MRKRENTGKCTEKKVEQKSFYSVLQAQKYIYIFFCHQASHTVNEIKIPGGCLFAMCTGVLYNFTTIRKRDADILVYFHVVAILFLAISHLIKSIKMTLDVNKKLNAVNEKYVEIETFFTV